MECTVGHVYVDQTPERPLLGHSGTGPGGRGGRRAVLLGLPRRHPTLQPEACDRHAPPCGRAASPALALCSVHPLPSF